MLRQIILIITLGSVIPKPAGAQSISATEVQGVVTDAITHEPMPYVNIRFPHTTDIGVTDTNGIYHIKTIEARADSISFSFLGYNTRTVPVAPGKVQQININMAAARISLEW